MKYIALFFIVTGMMGVAPAWAETLPWQAEKAQPQVKFFPINPQAFMRPPVGNYNLIAGKAPVKADPGKSTNGRTSISEEQARALLTLYAN